MHGPLKSFTPAWLTAMELIAETAFGLAPAAVVIPACRFQPSLIKEAGHVQPFSDARCGAHLYDLGDLLVLPAAQTTLLKVELAP